VRGIVVDPSVVADNATTSKTGWLLSQLCSRRSDFGGKGVVLGPSTSVVCVLLWCTTLDEPQTRRAIYRASYKSIMMKNNRSRRNGFTKGIREEAVNLYRDPLHLSMQALCGGSVFLLLSALLIFPLPCLPHTSIQN
jgi:hypothetical protein